MEESQGPGGMRTTFGRRVILALCLISVLSSLGASASDSGDIWLSSTSTLEGIDVPQQAEVAADDSPLESWLAGQIFVWAMIFILLVVPWMMARRPSGRAPPLTETTSSATASGSRFTSDRERRLWLYTVAVMIAIYSTLSPARELAAALRERGLLGVSSGAVMLVVGMVIAVNWAKTRPGRIEVAAGLGVAAAYLATMVRMPVPESHSHLFEYGLVAMLIDQALTERRSNSRRVPVPPLLALVATAGLGWIDEGIQAFLPNRVYDLVDVGQNAAFALMAITSSLFMRWARSLDILGPIRRLPAGDGQDSYATGVSQMTLFKALATVVGTAIGFGIAGTGIGAFLGRFTPALFRLFPLRDLENLDPSELGIGLGLVNGLIWGLVIGVLVVGIVSWRETRMSRKDQTGGDQA